MWLNGLHVDGFGALHDLDLELPRGLVVLHGPNEAGKTTLTAFLRYVLFGPRRGEAPEALAGGQPGGRLRVVLGNVTGTLERYQRLPAQLVLSDGRRLDGDAATRATVGQVDREMHDAIWSFALRDLTNFDALGEEDVRDRLFTGSLAGAGRSVAAAQDRIRREIDLLWKPRKGGLVRELEQRHRTLLAELARARQRVDRLGTLERERDLAEEERLWAANQREECERTARRHRAWLAALPHHLAWKRASLELEGLPDARLVPTVVAERAETAEVDRRMAAQVAQDRQKLVEEARRQLDPQMNEQRPRFEALDREDRDLSAEHLRTAREAHARLVDARSRSLRDAGLTLEELRGLRLGAAESGLLLERASAVDALQLRVAEGGDVVGRVEGDRAQIVRLAGALKDLPVDVAALEVAVEVEALHHEEPGIARRRENAAVRRAAEERARGELARLEPSLKSGVGDDTARARFEAEVSDWQRERTEATRTLELVGPSSPDATDPTRRALAALGVPWTPDALSAALSDAASVERLRMASRAVRDGVNAQRSAEVAVRTEEAELRRRGVDPATPQGRDVLEQQLGRLDALERARRRLEVASARAGGVPGWARFAAVFLAFCIAIVAVGLAFAGPALASVALLGLAAFVAVGGWMLLVPGGGSAELAELRAHVGQASSEAGLPPRASEEELVTARSRVQAQLRVAERAAALARARDQLADAEDALTRARGDLVDALRAARWPTISADTVDEAIVHLRTVAEAQAAAEHAARTRGERQERQAEARATLARLEAREDELRSRARRLGVPDGVSVADAPGWLRDARRYAEVAARAALHGEDARLLEDEAADWDRRLARVVLALNLGPNQGLPAARVRCAGASRTQEQRAPLEHRRGLAEASSARSSEELERHLVHVRRLAEARDSFREALAAVGLSRNVPSEGIKVLLLAITNARRSDDEAMEAEARLLEIEGRAARFVVDAVGLAQALGLPRPGSLEEAMALVDSVRERAARAAAAEATWREATTRQESAWRELAEAEQRLSAVLAEAAVADLEGLRAAVEHGKRRQALESSVEQAAQRRDAALGTHDGSGLDTPDEVVWERAIGEAEAAMTKADAERDAAVQRRSLTEREIEELRTSSDIARLDAERAFTQAELGAARRRLARAVLAQEMLNQTLQRYRDAHQPEILRAASAYFAEATRSAYVAVEADESRQDLIVVDSAGGRRRSSHLSTGTAELLYLVLRLGLARDQARHDPGLTGGLPLVLDDVLVNLDPDRAQGIANLLRSVAREHQVLLLTCRPETRDLLRAVAPDCAIVELPRYGGRAGPVASTIRGPTVVRAPVVRTREGLSEDSERILQVLRQRPGLGRRELLEQTGVSEDAWGSAIGALKQARLVVQEGEKRGAVYRPA